MPTQVEKAACEGTIIFSMSGKIRGRAGMMLCCWNDALMLNISGLLKIAQNSLLRNKMEANSFCYFLFQIRELRVFLKKKHLIQAHFKWLHERSIAAVRILVGRCFTNLSSRAISSKAKCPHPVWVPLPQSEPGNPEIPGAGG